MTTTALPVAREAKSPGQEFHVGNVLQPITSAMPRGTTVKVFSMRRGSAPGLGPGFSHRAVRGMRVISTHA